MNKIRPIILSVAVILAGLLAYVPSLASILKGIEVGPANFSRIGYVIFNVVVFILFFLVFALDGIRGRLKASKVFKTSVSVLGLAAGVLAFGELMAYVFSVSSGIEFKLFGSVEGSSFGNMVMLINTVCFLVLAVFGYMLFRGRAVKKTAGSMRANAAVAAASKYACTTLYGTLTLVLFLGVVLLIAFGANWMFLVPLCFATGGLWLWRLFGCRFMLVIAIVAILLHACSYLYALVMSLTIGAYGVVAMFAFCDFMVLIPLADLYLMPGRSR